jgi:hypothetical protein
MKEIFPLWRLAGRMEGAVRGPGVGSDGEHSSIGPAHAHQVVVPEAGIVDAQIGPSGWQCGGDLHFHRRRTGIA